MQFQQIKLRNWRVYFGEVTVSFQTSRPGNIWVVDGNNGYGKTSLLKAIQWAFHEAFPGTELSTCFNRQALANGDREMSVRLLFTDRGKQYNLTRRACLTNPGDARSVRVESEMLEDGRPVHDVQGRIDQMLPSDASQFFFFDGLEISKYAAISHSEFTQEAIERILGIPAVRNARTDLGTAIARWQRSLEDEIKNDAEAQQIFDQVEAKENLLKRTESRRNELHRELQNAEGLLEKIEEELSQVQGVAHLFKEKEERRQQLAIVLTQLDGLRQEEERFLANLPLLLLEEDLSRLQEKWQISFGGRQSKEIQEMTLQARIEELGRILTTNQCVCGHEVGDPEEGRIYQRISVLQRDLERIRIAASSVSPDSQHASVYLERLDRVLAAIRFMQRDPSSLLKRRTALEDEKSEIQQVIDKVEQKIGGNYDSAEHHGLIERRSEIKAEIKNIRAGIDYLASEVKSLENEIEGLRDDAKRLGEATPRRIALEGNLRLARSALLAIEGYIGDLIAEQKGRIEAETTKIHRLVTNKPDTYSRVRLRDDYSLDLVDKRDVSVPTEGISAGEREALAFSFIAGLNVTSNAGAPIVMDTPFGHLDDEHRRNILRALPQLPAQVVLLVTDRDLPPSERHLYEPSFAGQFVICYEDEGQSSGISAAL